MRNKSKLVYGVGRNDSDSPVTTTEKIAGKQKILWACPCYQAWIGMLERCYSEKFHDQYPTYAECAVASEWHSFSVFRAWMLTQDWNGKHLDKDLLTPGNKVYSPETCIFVPPKLNLFVINNRASRGEWPIGVSWSKGDCKFRAACGNPFTGKQDKLGMFVDPGEAHEAWRAKKHEHACRYADQQTDPRIAAALRSRYAPAYRQIFV